MKFHFTYILLSLKDKKLYIGSTQNVFKRLEEHNNGEKKTKSRIPFELLYYEAHRNKEDALRREKYFKTNSGKRTIRQMLRFTLEEMNQKE